MSVDECTTVTGVFKLHCSSGVSFNIHHSVTGVLGVYYIDIILFKYADIFYPLGFPFVFCLLACNTCSVAGIYILTG